MSDEFDDAVDALPGTPTAPAGAGRSRSARLIARLYGSANLALRTRVVTCLIRPLSPLGLAAIGAGAFTILLSRRGAGGISVAVADVAQFSKEQIAELARFVEQVSPEALAQVAAMVADNPVGVGAFTAAVGVLLALELRGASTARRRRARAQAAGA
jgi:hypothetical protein